MIISDTENTKLDVVFDENPKNVDKKTGRPWMRVISIRVNSSTGEAISKSIALSPDVQDILLTIIRNRRAQYHADDVLEPEEHATDCDCPECCSSDPAE
jgi:hypothetical protein